jgi:hypothetical protein
MRSCARSRGTEGFRQVATSQQDARRSGPRSGRQTTFGRIPRSPRAYALFGEGDSGKTTFTSLLKLTLGDYAAHGGWSEAPHALVCVYPEAEYPEACSVSCARDRGKPVLHARERPPAERWIVPVEFGSTFVAGLGAPDPWSRRYPRKQVWVHEWAPYHFVMMLEAYRAYRVVGYPALEAALVSRAPLLAPQAPSYLGLGFRSSGAFRASRASRPSRPSRPGTVYAFVTPPMPGIVKIGATTRELTDRLREASESDTWRPLRRRVCRPCRRRPSARSM